MHEWTCSVAPTSGTRASGKPPARKTTTRKLLSNSRLRSPTITPTRARHRLSGRLAPGEVLLTRAHHHLSGWGAVLLIRAHCMDMTVATRALIGALCFGRVFRCTVEVKIALVPILLIQNSVPYETELRLAHRHQETMLHCTPVVRDEYS